MCLQFERDQREEAGSMNPFSGDGPSKGILTLGQTVAELLTFGSHAMCLVHPTGFSGTILRSKPNSSPPGYSVSSLRAFTKPLLSLNLLEWQAKTLARGTSLN